MKRPAVEALERTLDELRAASDQRSDSEKTAPVWEGQWSWAWKKRWSWSPHYRNHPASPRPPKSAPSGAVSVVVGAITLIAVLAGLWYWKFWTTLWVIGLGALSLVGLVVLWVLYDVLEFPIRDAWSKLRDAWYAVLFGTDS